MCVLLAAVLPACRGIETRGGDVPIDYRLDGPPLEVACEVAHGPDVLAVHKLQFRVVKARNGSFKTLAATWDGWCHRGRWLTWHEFGGKCSSAEASDDWDLMLSPVYVWERGGVDRVHLVVLGGVLAERPDVLELTYFVSDHDGYAETSFVALRLDSLEARRETVRFELGRRP
jgi:hypothetical protein